MRKTGKPKARGRSGLSVYERHEKLKRVQILLESTVLLLVAEIWSVAL
jgi:hypothetical protein